jgi:hypothetical protein
MLIRCFDDSSIRDDIISGAIIISIIADSGIIKEMKTNKIIQQVIIIIFAIAIF